MESNNDSNNKKERLIEKALISDISRGLIDAGYGVNNKLLKYTEIKYLLKDGGSICYDPPYIFRMLHPVFTMNKIRNYY